MLHWYFVTLLFLLNWSSQFTCTEYQEVVNPANITRRRRQVALDGYHEAYNEEYDHEEYDYDDNDELQGRLAGGVKVNNYMREAPFAVALLAIRKPPKRGKGAIAYRCSGSFISPRTVLTAAHCFRKDSNANSYFITHNVLDPYDGGSGFEKIFIREIVRNHRYETMGYDVALLILFADARHLTPDSWNYLRLPLKNEEKTYLDPATTWLFSYGRDGPGKVNMLRKASVTLTNTVPPCPPDRDYRSGLRLCSEMGSIQTIKGDSGSPYVYFDGARKKILVAVHTGTNPTDPVTAGTISVWKVTKWILRKMKEKGIAVNGVQNEAFVSWGI